MIKYATYEKLPECCKMCSHRDSDACDEYSAVHSYCKLNLILPIRSGKCKKNSLGVFNKKGDKK